VLRKLLFATLALAPITIALHYVSDLSETTEFVLAALALIPLAWLIGEATEHAAEHTGPGIGGKGEMKGIGEVGGRRLFS